MNHEFDYAVVGGGLTGLLVATALSLETENVVLLDGQDHLGGFNRAIPFPSGSIENGIRFVPGTDAAQSSLRFLEGLLEVSILKSVQEIPPVTYEGGQLKTFLSFGEITPPFFDEMVYFTNSIRCELNIQPSAWVQLLLEKFRGQVMTRSFATRFQIANSQVQSLTLNGSKTLHAKNFIYCGSVKQLQTLLPPESLSSRIRQKLSKNTYWTGLCLDLCHAHLVTDSSAIHILNGTTQDEFGPCVGQFLPPVLQPSMQPSTIAEHNSSQSVPQASQSVLQASQWMTFIEGELSEESETVANALKKIKRQIKRVYPTALDNLVTERILVVPQISGSGDLKLKGNLTLPEVDNLWIGSPTLHPQKNLIGALSQAQMILASMGCTVPNFQGNAQQRHPGPQDPH